MTRITNFGRKRKYLEAGFTNDADPASNKSHTPETNAADAPGDAVRRKKKRRGGTKAQPDDNAGRTSEGTKVKESNGDGVSVGQKKHRHMKKRDGAKRIAISGYKRRTEQRRLSRILNRQANMICFACREKGHAAKDCPKAAGEGQKNSATVGICYRCGLTEHTLSRCKKPEDLHDPFPFVSCFVCSGKGHLASACPQNKEKGIYPNGGSCKLCGEKTHLAKDCELRKKDTSGTAASTIFGTGNGAGADEDDFHTFKRTNVEVSQDEKREDRRKKRLDVKAGLHTGTVKAFGRPQIASKAKKVVFF